MSTELPRIAVVGAGLIGKRHVEHAAAVGCLSAVVDPTDDASVLAQKHGVPHFRSVNSILAANALDGAIVATPTQNHAAIATELVAAGIPSLIEKPITDTVESAVNLVEQAEQAGVPVMVGHHRRFNPLISAAKAKIESGDIGNIVAVHAMCWLYKPDEYYDVVWRTKAGAGPLLTNLIHDIDLMRHFCGDVASVQMVDSNATREHEVEDTAVLILKFDSNAVATMSVSDTIVSPWSWEMTANENPAYPNTDQSCYLLGGTKGSLSIPDMQRWHHEDKRGWYERIFNESIKHDEIDPLHAQMLHFCQVIKGVEEPLVSGREGLKTLQVLHAAWEASESGCSVKL